MSDNRRHRSRPVRRRNRRQRSLTTALKKSGRQDITASMTDEQRAVYRKKRRRLAKKRNLFFRRLRFGICALLLLAAIVFLVVKALGFAHSVITKSKNVSDTVVNAAQVEMQTAEPATQKPAITVKYPVKSNSFVSMASGNISSGKAVLVDVENNMVIAGKGWEDRIYPASMTKVMTLIVAVENLKSMTDTFTMTIDIVDPLVRENASRAGFDPGEVVSAKDMLYGMILPSGADAAEGLAVMISGSEAEFVKLMNKKCQDMGLKNTRFANTSGLHDNNQYTTPVEMAMIMEYAMQNEICANILSTYQYTTQKTTQHPEGILLTSTMFSRMYGDEAEGSSITAGKTGYTTEAGNCMVSYGTRDGRHYVFVTAEGTNKWHSIFDAIEAFGKYLPGTAAE